MIFIVVKFPIRPDKLDEWERAREEHTRGARSEEGCLFFDYSQSVDDPNEYVCVEAFRDDDAAVHHVNTQAFKDFVERMPDIVSAPPADHQHQDRPGLGPDGRDQPAPVLDGRPARGVRPDPAASWPRPVLRGPGAPSPACARTG